ncbi:MAG TPA: glycosyltransferase family 4 protein [Polyangium sp.]|nr:glycosyltransferase family 4 protein [Polyangium sp.]
MRILLVTTSYPASDDDPSGHFVRAEARELARAGHEVHVVAPLAGRPVEQDKRVPSLALHRVGGAELFGWPGAVARIKTNPLHFVHAPRFVLHARRRIASLGAVDRVLGHWIVPAGFPVLFDPPAPLELVAHGADVRLLCAMPNPVRHAVISMLLDRRTNFRFVARASFQTLVEKLSPQLRERLVHASRIEPAAFELPDITQRAAEIRALMSEHERGFVVAVGRLIELKRFHLAIDAAAGARVPLVVIGDGPLRGELERRARERDARITFKGLLSRTETLAWIAASRVLVHPSRAEAAPTVVREARALGVSVVATPSGDLSMWAQKDPGIVLVEAHAEALGATIAAMIARQTTAAEKSVRTELF